MKYITTGKKTLNSPINHSIFITTSHCIVLSFLTYIASLFHRLVWSCWFSSWHFNNKVVIQFLSNFFTWNCIQLGVLILQESFSLCVNGPILSTDREFDVVVQMEMFNSIWNTTVFSRDANRAVIYDTSGLVGGRAGCHRACYWIRPAMNNTFS